MEKGTPDIRYLFEPRGLAVIGASGDDTKIGYMITDNIVSTGYRGGVYPVNPKGGVILGKEVYRSISDIDGIVDIAIISIPAHLVYNAVSECGKAGVKFIIIITSGFSEIGNREEERRIVEMANCHGMRVLGPNVFGIYSGKMSLNATFGPRDIVPGNVAILSQSGALGIAMIGKTAKEGIGLSTIISIGNKSDIDESDLLEYLLDDQDTRSIFLYIEGVKDGERFKNTLMRVTRRKPVVVIKSGRSKRGALAAASHTGSLAGSDDVFDAIMRQCGVVRAESIQEALNWCKYLSKAPSPTGESAVIVTNGGGIGVMATDACEKYGVRLLDDTDLTRDIFSPVTPAFGSTKNPVDITGGATAQDYNDALLAALENDRIHSVIALYCATSSFDMKSLSRMMEDIYTRYMKKGKPIIFSVLGGEKVEHAVNSLRSKGAPVFSDVYDAVQTLGVQYRQYHHQNDVVDETPSAKIDDDEVKRLIRSVYDDGRTSLLAHEAQRLMRACGVPMPKARVASSLEAAVRIADDIGYPVVLKIVSRDILHKSDAGGVALDLESREELIDAYQGIIRNARSYDPNAVIDGVEVAEMVLKGAETIVGARIDSSFGPVMMFGLGGIYVEVMKDVAFRSWPMDRRDILAMIKQTRSFPLLLGVRGEKRKEIDLIVETIIKLGVLLDNYRSISDIEINPLTAYELGKGIRAVDVRVILNEEGGSKS